MATEPSHGVTKRFTASLIDDDDLGGYLVVTNMVHAEGRNLSLVDARRLEEGGHVHIQVCLCRVAFVHPWRGSRGMGLYRSHRGLRTGVK